MKNLLKSIAVLSAILSFAACQKEIENPVEETKQTHTVTFVAGNPETKTAANVDIEQGVVDYVWKDTDADPEKFHVFENGVAATSITPSLNDGVMSITAEFNGELSGTATYTGYFNSGVQAVQTASGTDYDQLSDVLIAKETSSINEGVIPFQFKRLGAVCEVNLKGLAGTNLKTVKIEALDENVFLAGSLVDGELVGVSKVITVNCDNAITNGVGTLRFISMPIENANLRFIVETTDAQYVKKLGKEITFTRGDLKAFNVSGFTEIIKGGMWRHTFNSKEIESLGEIELDGQTWLVAGDNKSGYFGSDGNKGQQFGSGSAAFTELTLSSNFGEAFGISAIDVETSGASSIAATLEVTVGGVKLLCGESENATLTSNSTKFSFVSDKLLVGDVVLSYNQTSSKAIYVKEIVVNPALSCEAPTSDQPSGTLVGGTSIHLSSTTPGAVIYYTWDATEPTTSSILYEGEIITPTESDCTIKAIATKTGYVNSDVAEFSYTRPVCQTPVIEFGEGKVSISATPDNATIYYVIGGDDVADPTTSSSTYDAANKPSITKGQTVKAIAVCTGYVNSGVAENKYMGKAGKSDVIDNAATTTASSTMSTTATTSWVENFDLTGNSGAVYTIHSMGVKGTTNALQWNKNGWLYCKTSAGVIKSITIIGAEKKINIFASNAAFSGEPTGGALKQITASSSGTKYEFESEYQYLALHGAESSTTIASIVIEWGAPAELTGIRIDTPPTKTVYHAGESFDPAGMVVMGIYDDETEKDITKDCTIEPNGVLAQGTAKVTVSCEGFNAEQAIEVRQPWALESISVKTNPTKMIYYVGESFDAEGLVLDATYSDNSGKDDGTKHEDITSGYTYPETTFNTATTDDNKESVEISYNGKTCKVEGIEVKTATEKKNFSVTPLSVGPVAATAYNDSPITITADDDVVWTVSQIKETDDIDITFTSGGTGSGTCNVQIPANTGAARSFKLRISTTAYTDTPSYDVTISQAAAVAKSWKKVTDASTLAAGDKLLIVATVSGSKTSDNNGTFAANGTISNDIMGKVDGITISNNEIKDTKGAQEFILGGTSGNWTISNGSNLLGATAAKKVAWGSGTTTWSISISSGSATIQNNHSGTDYGKIMYNRDSPRFTTYTSNPSATMALPMIFRYE